MHFTARRRKGTLPENADFPYSFNQCQFAFFIFACCYFLSVPMNFETNPLLKEMKREIDNDTLKHIQPL